LKVSFFSPFNIPYSAYSLRIIHNALKKSGIPSRVYYYPCDFREQYTEETLRGISKYLVDSDIIGISLFTNHFNNVALLTKYLKESGTKALIIWGGVHALIRLEECLKYADIVCVGEAEECFPQLCKKIAKREPYKGLPGFWHVDRKTKQFIKNPSCMVEDLNKIPFALYSDDHFLIEKDRLVPLVDTEILYYRTLASRGCPFSCTYCIKNYYNCTRPRRIRYRSIENVIDELKIVKKQHNTIKYFWIDDDAFFAMNSEYIKEFSRRYKKEINKPLYVSGITPGIVSREKIKFLINANVCSVRMGIQTGSERILKLYKRNYNQNHVIKAMEIISSFYLDTSLDIITDNPWETEDDTLETIKLLDKIKRRFWLNIYNLVFFPGTELYERAKKEKLITDERNEIYMMRYHAYQKNALNMTLELIGMRAKYYLKLPIIVKVMLKKRLYKTKIYMMILKFYMSINKINVFSYYINHFVRIYNLKGWKGIREALRRKLVKSLI